jgi:hypothetical protein
LVGKFLFCFEIIFLMQQYLQQSSGGNTNDGCTKGGDSVQCRSGRDVCLRTCIGGTGSTHSLFRCISGTGGGSGIGSSGTGNGSFRSSDSGARFASGVGVEARFASSGFGIFGRGTCHSEGVGNI